MIVVQPHSQNCSVWDCCCCEDYIKRTLRSIKKKSSIKKIFNKRGQNLQMHSWYSYHGQN